MTTALWVRCVKCGKQTDTDHSREGVCRDCVVVKLVEPYRETYLRLIQKRKRYELVGRLRQFNDSQRIDAEKRIIIKLRMYAPWMTAAELSKYLMDCRQEAEGRIVQLLRGAVKILVAQPQDVRDHFAKTFSVPSMLGSGEETVGANTGIGVHRKFKLEVGKK